MKTRGDRIALILDETGMSVTALAKTLGITKATVSKWKSDATADMKLVNLLALEDKLGYSMRWFISGSGPRKISDILDLSDVPDEAKQAIKATVRVMENKGSYSTDCKKTGTGE